MVKAKAFLMVCAGIFLLALSYHLGARNAGAQAPGNPVVAGDQYWAFTANGDAYARDGIGYPAVVTYTRVGNVFSGPTPAQQES